MKPVIRCVFSLALLVLLTGCQSDHDAGFHQGEMDAGSLCTDAIAKGDADGMVARMYVTVQTPAKDLPEKSAEYKEGYQKGWISGMKKMSKSLPERLIKQLPPHLRD